MEEAIRNWFYIYVLSLENSIIRNLTWCCYLICMLMKLLKTPVKRQSILKEICCTQRRETTVDGTIDQKHYWVKLMFFRCKTVATRISYDFRLEKMHKKRIGEIHIIIYV